MIPFSQRSTHHASANSLAKLANSARRIQIATKRGLGLIGLVFFAAFLILAPASNAQDNVSDSKGIDEGNYNIQQTAEFGYRGDWINGNENNYNTFVNLHAGLRLFDYTLDAHSANHHGLLFDDLTFSNFGYGGDPDDVTRLRVDKNKWYDFQFIFRRDKNFWDYSLLANPLNPASSHPAVPITNSPHAMDLARHMQDYNLTIFPQSRVRFRLGYSRNVDEGPGFTTLDSGTVPLLSEAYRTTMNGYHAAVDFRLLPKTTLSYDQSLEYVSEHNVTTDNNLTDLLPGGVPVDLGILWNTTGSTPCATPFPAATPGLANPGCNGFLAYSNVSRPKNFMPTERFTFQSSYFNKLEMSGGAGYSTSDNQVHDFSEIMNGLTSRTDLRGSTAAGPSIAKRVSVNADWSGIYSATDKFRIVDSFRYDNWRIPGTWSFTQTNLYSVAPAPGGIFPSMLLPVAQFTAANCPAPFTAATCPQHASGSGADVDNGIDLRFLGQNLKSNIFSLEYDFAKRFTGRIGYFYENRKIADFNATFDTAEIFFPGGATGTPTNFHLAARGDCTLVAGVLPAGCTHNPDGSITFCNLAAVCPANTGSTAANDTARNVTDINEQALLLGLTARPMDSLRITGDFEFGYNDYAYTRTSPRQMQSYKIHVIYTPRQWISVDGAIDIHENRDNVFQVNNLEHGRTYSFVTVLYPEPKFSFDIGYNYTDIYSQADICFAASGAGVPTYPACPIAGSPVPLRALSFYSSKQHFAYADVIWKPIKRVTAGLGYSGTFVGGNTLFLNPHQPAGSLAFNYQKPYGMIQIDLYRGLSYKMAWNYYGYNGKAPFNVTGLAPIGSQDFNGNTSTFSVRYAF